MKKNALFITFEGTDGVGKSTQARLLCDWFNANHRAVISTREPGGGPMAERIRELVLSPDYEIEPFTELMLYEAARVEHVERVIRPSLKKGVSVICDRYTDATLAYQGFARNLPLAKIKKLNDWATSGLKPDLTLWLDLAPKKGLSNTKRRNGAGGDRMENEGLSFQERVYNGYKKLASSDRRRIVRIPVQENPADTQALIRAAVQKKDKF